jgi:hypothetical protein
MTAITQFQQKLKAGEVRDAFALAISEAVELEITTSVFSGDISIDNLSYLELDEPLAGYCLRTRINVIDGEIEQEIGEEFMANEGYVELKQLHQEQVKQGREILAKNLQNLQQMLAVYQLSANRE